MRQNFNSTPSAYEWFCFKSLAINSVTMQHMGAGAFHLVTTPRKVLLIELPGNVFPFLKLVSSFKRCLKLAVSDWLLNIWISKTSHLIHHGSELHFFFSLNSAKLSL